MSEQLDPKQLEQAVKVARNWLSQHPERDWIEAAYWLVAGSPGVRALYPQFAPGEAWAQLVDALRPSPLTSR